MQLANTKIEKNGIFNGYMEKIVKQYQESKHMLVDGVVNERVWIELYNDY